MLKNPDPKVITESQRAPPTLEIAMETCLQDPTARKDSYKMNGTSPQIRQNRSGPLMTLQSPTNSSQNMLI